MTKRPKPAGSSEAAPPSLAWLAPKPARSLPRGYDVACFDDSDAFLLDAGAFDFDFYVIDVRQTGVGGIDLVRLIRRHGPAGVLVLDPPPQVHFVQALEVGADMVVPPNLPREHLEAALAAVRRRTASGALAQSGRWRLALGTARLWAPSGTPIALGESDLRILACFADAAGKPVDRETLMASLWGKASSGMDNALQATIYRLRKRIEASVPEPLPIRAVARTGYEFRGTLDSD